MIYTAGEMAQSWAYLPTLRYYDKEGLLPL